LLGAAEIISATIIDFLYENFIIILIYDHFVFSHVLQCVYSLRNDRQTNKVASNVSFLTFKNRASYI
jgi:hypothetical protein